MFHTLDMQTLARMTVELKAIEFVNMNIGSWNEESKISQLAHIKAIDSRVLTKDENQYIIDFQNGLIK